MEYHFIKSGDPEHEGFSQRYLKNGMGITTLAFSIVGVILLLIYGYLLVQIGLDFWLPGLALPIVGTVLSLVGLFFFLIYKRDREMYLRIMKYGNLCEAEITDASLHVRTQGGSSTGSYTGSYRFVVQEIEYAVSQQITAEMAQELEKEGKVMIRYDVDNPEKARIVKHQMYL